MKTIKRNKFYGRLILGTAVMAGMSFFVMAASTPSGSAPGGGLFGGGGEGGDGALDLSAYDIEVVIKDNKFDELKAFGDVLLNKDGMKLTSDMLKYDPNEETMTAEVNKSPRVRIVSEDTTAVCGRAIYDMGKKVYNLMGGCVITEADGTETSSESMNIFNDNGKMKAIASSTLDARFGSAVGADGKRTATSEKLENSVKDVQKTLNISEKEARAHIVEKSQPATITINPNGKAPDKAGVSEGPASGLINSQSWNRVPGGSSSGLETED